MLVTNHQRKDAQNNSAAGAAFELLAQNFWRTQGIDLQLNFPLEIGVSILKKQRKFDLGSKQHGIILECKSHRWTESDNLPSAKVTVWNESMYYFSMCPPEYRKIFFCLRDFSLRRQCTLADYYVNKYAHMIPDDVEIWEYDDASNTAKLVGRP